CMSTYQYEAIYDALRARIEAGEFAVGDRLPSISSLQDEYDVPSLGTVRAAQQLLVEDGMIRTEQRRGAFVTSAESAHVLDLDGDDDTYFVLTDALTEWAERVEDEVENNPYNAEDRRRWAGHARELLASIEEALERTINPKENA